MSRLSQTDIDLAKSADLIEYMLTVHPDCVVKRYDVRDIDHDSLVLYHDSYCRYSTNEVNDNIAYLTRYQGYAWRDAVLSLKRFYLDIPSDYEYEPHPYQTGQPKKSNGVDDISKSFYQPVSTNRIDLIKDYLHNQRGISEFVLDVLIKKELLYAATARGFGTLVLLLRQKIFILYGIFRKLAHRSCSLQNCLIDFGLSHLNISVNQSLTQRNGI